MEKALQSCPRSPKKGLSNRDELHRFGTLQRMEGEGNERRFVLSFSSEEPCERWFGTEILDHAEGAMDMSRISEIGCVLFNHDRNRVIGKILRAWVENSRGMAEIEFDTDSDSETIYQKVSSGTLKGVSVGYVIDALEDVREGKTSVDGRFNGPCSIARKWTPYEVSIVSLPADPTVGVGRELSIHDGPPLDVYERQIKTNWNWIGG